MNMTNIMINMSMYIRIIIILSTIGLYFENDNWPDILWPKYKALVNVASTKCFQCTLGSLVFLPTKIAL